MRHGEQTVSMALLADDYMAEVLGMVFADPADEHVASARFSSPHCVRHSSADGHELRGGGRLRQSSFALLRPGYERASIERKGIKKQITY